MKRMRRIILSCEHAGNRVPRAYKYLFTTNPDVLKTHRAYDIGIAPIVVGLQKALKCPLCLYEWTRLLIDVNRTRRVSQFSKFSRQLSDTEKQHLIDTYDAPYKNRLKGLIDKQRRYGPVLHLSLHSFTPVWKGKRRNADIGILYDPTRKQEKQFAETLQTRLGQELRLRVRRNYPYLGRAEGMTTRLRRQYSQKQYMGIEIELNQGFLGSLTAKQQQDLVNSLAEAL